VVANLLVEFITFSRQEIRSRMQSDPFGPIIQRGPVLDVIDIEWVEEPVARTPPPLDPIVPYSGNRLKIKPFTRLMAQKSG